jgi:serine/threonine protein phosphatase 1
MPLTYAIGDVHGSLDMLVKLVARCHVHAADTPMTLVFLGDYIDRGPNSAGVVQLLMELAADMPGGVIALKGNHEAMALDVLDGAAPAEFWLSQGGAQTLASYGGANVHAMPQEHVQWLRALPTHFDDGRRFFVHAGVDPQRPLDAQKEEDLLWIREPFLFDDRDYGRLIVHGHTPLETGTPDLRANRLNLDTGAVFGGPLTAAVFDDATTDPIAFLQVE